MNRTPAAVVALLVVATVLLVGGAFGLWLQRQALDTDRWVATSGRMLDNEKIRTAVGDFVVERAFPGQGDGEQSGLGSIASGGLREVARRTAIEALGTGEARAAWEQANRTAHGVLLQLVDGRIAPGGEVTLDMSTLAGSVAAQVAERTGLAERRSAPDARIAILHSGQLERTQDIVRGLRTVTWLLLIAAAALIAVAAYLHPDWLRVVMMLGGCLVVAGLAVFALRWVSGHIVVGDLVSDPGIEPAGYAAWGIATSMLVQIALGLIILGAVVAGGAWLAGRRGSEPGSARAARA